MTRQGDERGRERKKKTAAKERQTDVTASKEGGEEKRDVCEGLTG